MAIKTSKSAESYYAKYKTGNLYAKNRKAKLERQLKLQPGNTKQLELALKNVSNYRRKTPTNPTWSHQMIATARMLKEFTGKFDKLAFAADDKISAPVLKLRNDNLFTRSGKNGVRVSTVVSTPKTSMFSIGTRAHNAGVQVWN